MLTSFVFMKILQDSTTRIINYVPTTIVITHYISQINYSAKTCAFMKMMRKRTYSHVIRGSLSCLGSAFYLMSRFHIICTDSGFGFLTVILGVDFMYLIRVAIWILLMHVILNASFIHI